MSADSAVGGTEAVTGDTPGTTPGTTAMAPAPAGVSGATSAAGQEVVFPARARYHEVVEAYRDGGFELLSDLCGTDYLAYPGRTLPEDVAPERFELVVSLLSLSARRRVRLRVQIPEADPVVDSVFDLFSGSEAMEREVFDMYGIRFLGHPDLTRILMPEDWEGFPLRKDYGVGRVPVQFKDAPGPR